MDNSVEIPKVAVMSAANGVMFMTFFGALWASIGVIGSHGLGAPWLLVFSGIVTLVLLFGSITLFGRAKKFTNSSTQEDSAHWKMVNRKFMLIFGLEGVAIAIASVICNVTNHFELFFPIMAIIVGVHFFPLARLFRVNSHHVTGAILCVLGIITFFLPMSATVAGVPIILTSVFIGFASALTLWANGLSIWITTLKKIR
jgi:hypothetical protein